MEAIILALLTGIAVFVLIVLLMSKGGKSNSSSSEQVLRKILDENTALAQQDAQNGSVLKTDESLSTLVRTASLFPGGKNFVSLAMKAGYGDVLGVLLGMFLLITFVLMLLISLSKMVPIMIALAPVLTYIVMCMHFKKVIAKRNQLFIDQFPDVLDIIVRSVRSGFPLQTAMKVVAENIDAPTKHEFQQVIEEVALGRQLDDALKRLAMRIDEQDVHFFVIALRVQQETGGSLSEIMSNLAGIIRKRKLLRHKIKALTAEGRASGVVLGILPVILFGAMYYVSPDRMNLFFITDLGNMLLGACAVLLLTALIVVKSLLKIDI